MCEAIPVIDEESKARRETRKKKGKNMSFTAEIFGTLKNVTSENMGGVMYCGEPTDAFWTLWNEKKGRVKAAGYNVYRLDNGKWEVSVRERDLSNEMTEEEAKRLAVEKISEKMFFDANPHLVGNSKTC